MPFEPKSGNHAIVEAVFGLTFSRAFEAAEVDKVEKAHDEWRSFLPRVSRGMGFQIAPGHDAIPLGAAIAFERMLPDGSLEWRLRIEGNTLLFNCLTYTRWNEVWPRAQKYMARVVELANPQNLVRSALLQYVDVFEWQGDHERYDVAELLRRGEAVPATVFERGPLWHLHQGWYRHEPSLPNGRLLERVHLDAVMDERGRPTVRVDSFLSYELNSPQLLPKKWTNRSGTVGDWFEVLHTLDKKLLKSVLNQRIAERIKLDV